MELRNLVDEKFMERLRELSGVSDPAEITRDALGVYKWVLKEVRDGRMIVSTENDGTEPKVLKMEPLQRAFEKR